MPRTTIFTLTLLFGSGAAATARADDGKGAGARWEVGARFHFMTVNPVLDFLYDEHESVNGYTVGPVVTRRAPDGNTRLILGLDYTRTSPEDGPWLGDGDDPPEAEWTEFRNFSILSANFMVGHVARRGPFGFFFGAGLGLDIVSGSITTYDVDANGRKLAGSEPDEKNVPSITPTLLFKMGPQFELGKMGTVSLDVGLHNGLFAGASLSTGLPF